MRFKPSIVLASALAALAAGCAKDSATHIPLTKDGALAAFQPIQNSEKAPCPMQRDVAAHNTAYDSLKRGKPVVYRAPCDMSQKPPPVKPAAKPEPKTS